MEKAKRKKDKETNVDKQIKKIVPFVIALLVLAGLFCALYFLFKNLGKVEYEGMTFTKEKYGEILVYSYTYLVKTPEGKIRENVLYLRGDPRKSNVSIEGRIVYPRGDKVYISINGTGLTECEDSLISIASLSNFLSNNNLPVKGGTPDKEEAKANNMSYVSCDNYESSVVIAIRASDRTRITKSGEHCHNLEVSNCEILPAVEKFIVQSLIDAKA